MIFCMAWKMLTPPENIPFLTRVRSTPCVQVLSEKGHPDAMVDSWRGKKSPILGWQPSKTGRREIETLKIRIHNRQPLLWFSMVFMRFSRFACEQQTWARQNTRIMSPGWTKPGSWMLVQRIPPIRKYMNIPTGWWFGTFSTFPIYIYIYTHTLGIIIPTDSYFVRGLAQAPPRQHGLDDTDVSMRRGCSKSWRTWTRTTMTSLAKMSSGLSLPWELPSFGAPQKKWWPKFIGNRKKKYSSCNVLYVYIHVTYVHIRIYGYKGFIDKLTTERHHLAKMP